MPMDRSRYPPNWEAISRRVRFDRAGGRCEATIADGRRCEAPHGELIERWEEDPEQWQPTADPEFPHTLFREPITVVITTAHTCACDPICDDETHMLALCQLHHLRLDAEQHRRNAAATRQARKGFTNDLFIEGGIAC